MHRQEVKKGNCTVKAFLILKTLGFSFVFESAGVPILYLTWFAPKKKNQAGVGGERGGRSKIFFLAIEDFL